MRILHISTHQTGGAALAAFRIHKSMLDLGVESRMLTLDGELSIENVKLFHPFLNYNSDSKFAKLVRSLQYRLNIGMGRYWRMHDNARKGHECQYSYPVSPYHVENDTWVKWADVIHLHWCDDFINYPSFFKKVKKPIFWTFHDIGIGFGGFHYLNDYNSLLPYFAELEKKFIEIKRKALSCADNLNIISLSEEMYSFINGIDYLNNHTIFNIANSVDTSKYHHIPKDICLKNLNLPNDKTILLFVCEYVNVKSKGLDTLKEAIAQLHNDNIFLCIVGNYPSEMPSSDCIPTKYFGKISDSEVMSMLYSASDFLVVPSSQESFGQTPLESMSCGTPVVVFPAGAMKEYVIPGVGIVCNDFTVSSLKEGISNAMNSKFDSQFLRDYVSNNFSPKTIAQKHLEYYKSALEKK